MPAFGSARADDAPTPMSWPTFFAPGASERIFCLALGASMAFVAEGFATFPSAVPGVFDGRPALSSSMLSSWNRICNEQIGPLEFTNNYVSDGRHVEQHPVCTSKLTFEIAAYKQTNI